MLNQKWAILYLLHQLADASTSDDASLMSEVSQNDQDHTLYKHGRRSEAYRRDTDLPVFDEAFLSTEGAKLPTHGSHSREVAQSRQVQRSDRDESREPSAPRIELSLEEKDSSIKPSETALLRDLPFTLQGLSTAHLCFSSANIINLPPSLPLPLISLLHTLAEPSLLYRSLSDYVQSHDDGLIGQSLKSAIGDELRSYLGLVAALENEIRRATAGLETNEARISSGKVGVTLKRCVIWTREATMGLRLMSLIAEEGKSSPSFR